MVNKSRKIRLSPQPSSLINPNSINRHTSSSRSIPLIYRHRKKVIIISSSSFKKPTTENNIQKVKCDAAYHKLTTNSFIYLFYVSTLLYNLLNILCSTHPCLKIFFFLFLSSFFSHPTRLHFTSSYLFFL